MGAFEFTSPEGKKYRVEGPPGATQEQAWGILQGQLGQAPAEQGLLEAGMESVGKAAQAFPGSVKKAGSDLWNLVTHADDVIAHVKEVGFSGVMGEFKDDLVEHYGSWEKAKRTFETDPFRFLTDVSLPLTAGGGIALKGVSLGSKILRKTTEHIAPLTTGAPRAAFQMAGEAGAEGGPRAAQFRMGQQGVVPQRPGQMLTPEYQAGKSLSEMLPATRATALPKQLEELATRTGLGAAVTGAAHAAGLPWWVAAPASIAAQSPRGMGSLTYGLGAAERGLRGTAGTLGGATAASALQQPRELLQDQARRLLKSKVEKKKLSDDDVKTLRAATRPKADSKMLLAASRIIGRRLPGSPQGRIDVEHAQFEPSLEGATGEGARASLVETRQEGGPVEPGKPYLVGEQGPEVVVPQDAGMVIPSAPPTDRAPTQITVTPPDDTLPLPGQSPGLSRIPTTGEKARTDVSLQELWDTLWSGAGALEEYMADKPTQAEPITPNRLSLLNALQGTFRGLSQARPVGEIKDIVEHTASLPRRGIEAAQHYAETGEYDPAPIMETALTTMGGTAFSAPKGALGAGPAMRPWTGAVGVRATPVEAAGFHEMVGKVKADNPHGAAVHQYTPEEYQGMHTITTPDRTAGIAVKPDGDIVSVAKHPSSPHPAVANSLIPQAIAAGGRKLDAFDTELPHIYGRNGFRAVARVKWNDAHAPPGWDKAKFKKYNNGEPDVVFMVYDPYRPGYHAGQGKLMSYDEAVALQGREVERIGARMQEDEAHFDQVARQVTGLKGVKQYLTPAELKAVTVRGADELTEMFRATSPEEMAAVAYSGRAKRGWYKNSAQALLDIFGLDDAPRFTALLAAMSPRISVEGNTLNALRTWNAWVKAGRPTTRRGILAAMNRGVGGAKGMGSVMGAWRNNAVRALMSDDPLGLILSGPKVDSFWRNLIGRMQEATNDAWMASYHGVNPKRIGGRTMPDPADTGMRFKGKSPSYLGMTAMTRRAAQVISEKLGEVWTPAEIQETIWSWAKTLKEKAGKKGAPDPTVEKILKAGNITHAEIANTPDFALLFTEGVYRKILERGGYGKQLEEVAARSGQRSSKAPGGTPVSEAGPFTGLAYKRHLLRAGRRLDVQAAPKPSD